MKNLIPALVLLPCFAMAQATHTDVKILSKDIQIAATLCTPEKETKKVFLIIPGSGPTDRNCNSPMLKTNAFLQMADSLAAKGFASLRYDKRGIGSSHWTDMREEDITFDLGIMDAVNCMNWLKKEGFETVIIAGHSEGSLVGMIAANEGASGFISMCGISVPAHELLKTQLGKQLNGTMYDQVAGQLDSLAAGLEVNNNNPMLQSIFRKSVQPYLISWMSFDPCEEINRLEIPVLVLGGDEDMQIEIEEIEKLAQCAYTKGIVIRDMTHTLKRIAKPTEQMNTYTDPAYPLHPELLRQLVVFGNQVR